MIEIRTRIDGSITLHDLRDYLYESDNGVLNIDVDDMVCSETFDISSIIKIKRWAPGFDKHCTIYYSRYGDVNIFECYEDYEEVLDSINKWKEEHGYKKLS